MKEKKENVICCEDGDGQVLLYGNGVTLFERKQSFQPLGSLQEEKTGWTGLINGLELGKGAQ